MKCIAFCACDDNTGTFCIVRAVKKFDSRLVIDGTSNKYRPQERKSYSDGDLFFTGCVFQSAIVVSESVPTLCRSTAFPWVKNITYPMHGIQSLSGAEVLTDRESNATSPLVGIFGVFRRISKVLRSEQGVGHDLAESRHGRIDQNSTLFSSWFATLLYGPQTINKTVQCGHFYSYWYLWYYFYPWPRHSSPTWHR